MSSNATTHSDRPKVFRSPADLFPWDFYLWPHMWTIWLPGVTDGWVDQVFSWDGVEVKRELLLDRPCAICLWRLDWATKEWCLLGEWGRD